MVDLNIKNFFLNATFITVAVIINFDKSYKKFGKVRCILFYFLYKLLNPTNFRDFWFN